MQEGDTVNLIQRFPAKNSLCNQRKQVLLEVQNSFTLKTAKPAVTVDDDLVEGIYGISMVINSNCSEICTMTIAQSHFTCSSLTFNNFNILVKDSMFKSGFITARSVPQVDSNSYNTKIQDTEFYCSTLMKDKRDTGLIKTGPSQQMNFINVHGYWDSVNILGSVMKGDREGSISGIEIVHANVRTLTLIGVQFSFLFSALVVSSSSAVDTFNVTDSIFLGNRDGIDIGQGVRYMLVSRSQMNNTGLWFRNWDVHEQCNSALRGSAQRIIVEESIFAHNHASGINCEGAALYLGGNAHDKPLLMSNIATFENGNLEIPTVEVTVEKSVFYDNMVENCSARLDTENGGGGGAVAVYGLHLMIKVMASNFERNKACKGAGLYVSMSDWWLMGYSHNRAAGQGQSSTITISTCTFNENTAQFGGGLMTDLIESTLTTDSSLSTLIHNSLFSQNDANYIGAGVLLNYFNVSLNPGVRHVIKVSDTVFKENRAGNIGGGMSVKFRSLTLMPNTSVGNVVHNCTFTSNKAGFGAGISTDINFCSLYSNSSLTLQTSYSTFTYNAAGLGGAGIAIRMRSCSLYPNSFLTSQISYSTFTSNTADWGAGISRDIHSCSLHPYSSFIFETSHSNFTSNTAQDGAGINTEMLLCSLYSNASLTLQTSYSTFTYNSAGRAGAGIAIRMRSCSLYPNSSLTSQTYHSTFTSNTAKSGAGIYTEVHIFFLHINSSLALQTSNSAFTSNTAEVEGAGMVTSVKSCSLYSSSSITLQTTHSTFLYNTAWYNGAGIFTSIESCSLHANSSMIFQTFDSNFTSNTAVSGAGIYTEMDSCSLYSSTFLTFQASHSIFTSNTVGVDGASISTYLVSCFLYANSSMIFQTTDSNFTFNTAELGAGIYSEVKLCSLHPESALIFHTSDSIFTSNTAKHGAGIYTGLFSTSLYRDSAMTFHTSDSMFISNTAEYGAGICTNLLSCTLHSNSSLTLQISHSTFMSNTAHYGAGISTEFGSCSLHPNSSLTLHTSDSIFRSNTAWRGSGIIMSMDSCSLYSNSSLALEISGSTFTSSTARYGAGIFASMGSCCLYPFSLLTLQVRGSTFSSNTAGKGAGLGVRHSFEDSFGVRHFFEDSFQDKCVAGEITVGITECWFLNNSASSEGGSLYFKVFPITQVHVEQSVFKINQALPGSGLYRENIDFPICNIPTYNILTQALITTHVSQCQIFDNIDTAIVVKNKNRFGTLAITKCLFKNNTCIKSLIAEDVFTDFNFEMKHTKILRETNSICTDGIYSQSEAKLQNVTVNTLGLPRQRQISIATFSHYMTKVSRSFVYHCPDFHQPTLSHSGLTNVGAVMLKATCDSCFEAYYSGKSHIVISNENGGNKGNIHCHENCYCYEILNEYNHVIDINELCYTNTTGTCIECPHGANCSTGVVSLPNYWGHMTGADRLEFHRCPLGYCCNKAPCQGIAQCAAHREGILCGRCMKGFTESLITPECIPDKSCRDWWIFPLFCFWAFTITLILVFSQDILQIKDIILMRIKRNRSTGKKDQSFGIESDEIELRSNREEEIQSTTSSVSSCDSREIILNNLRSIQTQTSQSKLHSAETQTPQAKTPILWGSLTMQREENAMASGSHKYLQIMVYYLQDAALMQIDLAVSATVVSPIQKLRQLLLNISQLAVDLIDLGLNLCPVPGWTPVSKLLTKNLTGPCVFLYIFTMYGIVRVASQCFPSKRKLIRAYWYPRLTAATIFSILLFYQQIANVAFSLQHCINSGDQMILFIDGNVRCVQPWQTLVFIFTFNWVIGIIPVLMFLPGLLEVGMIRVSQFFLACLMPLPMWFYWVVRFYRKKLKVLTSEDNATPWHEEALRILQKTFVKTTNKKGFPICWIGFMKVRRLVLVITFTFVSNLVARISIMCFFIQLFLLFHLKTEPYQDALANKLYTASLLATLAIGFMNIMKASCIEFYLDLDKVAHFLTTLNMITDCIVVYLPLGFVGITIAAILIGKVKGCIQKKRKKQNYEVKRLKF